MVRECTHKDIQDLILMSQKFNAQHYGVPLNLCKLSGYLPTVIDNGVTLRTDKGMIIGVLADDPIRDWKVLVELAWYSEGRDGGTLLSAFEQAGRNSGANEVRMTTLSPDSLATRILIKLGYTLAELSYSKRL